MIELKVQGMSCGGCATRVTKSVQALDRDARVVVDLQSKEVRIESTAQAQVIASAITAAGYPAVVQGA